VRLIKRSRLLELVTRVLMSAYTPLAAALRRDEIAFQCLALVGQNSQRIGSQ
jgi:hypothetical protein